MEFLDYKEFVNTLRENHVAPRAEGDLVRFEIEGAPGKAVAPAQRLRFAPKGSPNVSADVRMIITPRERLPDVLDALIHSARISEVAIIPAGQWRTLMDLVAYELASDESWLDVDAEASLHLNTRDPLLLNPPDLHILRTLTGALLSAVEAAGGGEPTQDLTIVAPGSTLIFELDHAGAVNVQCANASVADHLAAVG